jgi:hypothetical protein
LNEQELRAERRRRISEALNAFRQSDTAGRAQRKVSIQAALAGVRRSVPASRMSDRDLAAVIVRAGLSEADGKAAMVKLRTARIGESVTVDGVTLTRESAGVSVAYARPCAPIRIITGGADVAAILGVKRAAS